MVRAKTHATALGETSLSASVAARASFAFRTLCRIPINTSRTCHLLCPSPNSGRALTAR